jgi:diguanylate cyclase (GGDEF)-like protein/PAS domain S-box-containing protein
MSLPLRASICLTSLMLSLLFLAFAVGLIPDSQATALQGRKVFCEQLAVSCAYLVERQDAAAILPSLEGALRRHPNLVSAAVRAPDGKLLLATSGHETLWSKAAPVLSTPTHIRVPIAQHSKPWGTLELSFRDEVSSLVPFLRTPILPLVGFAGLAGGVLSYLYLRLILSPICLPQVGTIPRRVRTALNTLAEGVVILDDQEQIVVANKAFADLVGSVPAELEGKKVSELGWANHPEQAGGFPWQRSLEEGIPQVGTILTLELDDDQERILSVNTSPIVSEDGRRRGAMATFDNLTVLERKNSHLRSLLLRLRKSRTEIRSQNKQLKILATRDPLTGCLNRRAFFQHFETHWSAALAGQTGIACIMVDIDHFKSINDRFGHSTGDQVLQQVVRTLRSQVRKCDLVGRYGGEEFCILLPGVDLEEAMQIGERCRQAISAQPISQINVTASLGVSGVTLGAKQPSEMLDQADKSLYVAKHGGRNRVVGWHQVPADQAFKETKGRSADPRSLAAPVAVPFHAVTALVAALGHRHAETAEHSRRVADLCVAMAGRLLSRSECYILEVAALLHDVGKLGVPDSVLLKPAPLDANEWKIIRTHESISEEIIDSAFSCRELSSIVGHRHSWFGGTPDEPDRPVGENIPLGARILAIADAYDAMTTDRVYRKGRSREEALSELRRCAGTQFDPELVERFAEVTQERDTNWSSGLAIDKQVALQIGLQIEKLASALDANDTATLGIMARHLHTTATTHGVDPIGRVARALAETVQERPQSVQVAQLTIQLIDVCRATYRSYLPLSGSEGDQFTEISHQ